VPNLRDFFYYYYFLLHFRKEINAWNKTPPQNKAERVYLSPAKELRWQTDGLPLQVQTRFAFFSLSLMLQIKKWQKTVIKKIPWEPAGFFAFIWCLSCSASRFNPANENSPCSHTWRRTHHEGQGLPADLPPKPCQAKGLKVIFIPFSTLYALSLRSVQRLAPYSHPRSRFPSQIRAQPLGWGTCLVHGARAAEKSSGSIYGSTNDSLSDLEESPSPQCESNPVQVHLPSARVHLSSVRAGVNTEIT